MRQAGRDRRADGGGRGGRAGAWSSEQADGTRVVVLLGAPGSGKSTVAAALLAAAGRRRRTRRGRAGSPRDRPCTAAAGCGCSTRPGAPDLEGELAAGLRAAGAAVLVVSPVQGLDPRSALLWERCEAAGLPRLVVVTQLDRAGRGRRRGGRGVPAGARRAASCRCSCPCTTTTARWAACWTCWRSRCRRAGRAARRSRSTCRWWRACATTCWRGCSPAARTRPCSSSWLGGEEPASSVLAAELAAAVGARGPAARRRGGAADGRGPDRPAGPAGGRPARPRRRDRRRRRTPPTARPPPCSRTRAGPLVAEVVRGGRPALLRVWSGTLRPGAAVARRRRPAGDVRGRDRRAGRPRRRAGRAPGRRGVRSGDAAGARPLAGGARGVPGRRAPGRRARRAGGARPGRPARDRPAHRAAAAVVDRAGPRRGCCSTGCRRSRWRWPPAGAACGCGYGCRRGARRPSARELAARGEVLANERTDDGAVLEARLPPAELVGWAPALARASAYTGTFERLPG